MTKAQKQKVKAKIGQLRKLARESHTPSAWLVNIGEVRGIKWMLRLLKVKL